MAHGESQAGLRLGQAISAYLSTLPQPGRQPIAQELARFSRWLGPDLPIARINPLDVARYQEQLPESSVQVNRRLVPVKDFLTHLRSQKLTTTNLAAHVRLKRQPAGRSGTAREGQEPETIRLTQEGHVRLTSELGRLENEVRPQVTEALRLAAADKDFRENAPYDAAKQKLAEVQGRINDIRATLAAGTVHTGDSIETVDLGTTVTIHSLADGEEVVYTIVGPGEVSPREGKISPQSPVGSALMDRRPGDVVEVQTPAGAHTFRVEKIERRK